MAHRIEVALKPGMTDAAGTRVAHRIREDLALGVEAVRTVEVYTVDAELDADELERVAQGPFSDPVIQEYAVDRAAAPPGFDWLVEVGFLPGVTDNVGRTAREAIEFCLDRKLGAHEGVYTARQYLIASDELARPDVERIATGLLANDLIQRSTVIAAEDFDRERGLPAEVPKVTDTVPPRVEAIDLEAPDEELMRISREGTLALSLEEMQTIRDHYRDPQRRARREAAGLPAAPTDVELECLAQTWSEHCKHKIFNAEIEYTDEQGHQETVVSLFDTCIRGTTKKIREALGDDDFCRSVFVDNAGVVGFTDDYDLVMKVETHNSPSALDPYGGALTGIVGVNRDPFGTGMGAQLVFNTDVFCFASPFYEGQIPARLLHPKRVLEGVREGVEHGGNKSGIPTVNGSVLFDVRYLGKPLVYCGTGGLLPARVGGKPGWDKTANPGDRIVMTGGRIGKDGIHGATFSSEELHEGSPATAVQIGDPITQKRMTDFLLRARDEGLYRCITDNGAGGLSSSVGETAEFSGGAELHLDRAPLKYAGLMPWEIFLSEAQERMTLAVPPDRFDRFMELAGRMEVEATDLGEYTDSGSLRCYFGGKVVADLDMGFLHEGVPRMKLQARFQPELEPEPALPLPADLAGTLMQMLGRLNVCSKEYWVRQYDHEVQGGSVVKPLCGSDEDGPSDAAVVRPLLDRFDAAVVSHGICPRYSDIDAYGMAANAVDEAVRNAVAVGADPDRIAGLDNFCWCDPVKSEKTPDGDHKLAQLVRACKAVYDVCTAYGVPLISGKDSMKNDAVIEGRRISIPPTLLVSALGRLSDARKAVTMDAKNPGDRIYVLGTTRAELGASEYYAMHGAVGRSLPQVRPEEAISRFRALHRAIDRELVASCHDCSDGGLGVALAETAFAGGLGLRVDLAAVPRAEVEREDLLLFSETPSRFVVTVRPEHAADFEAAMQGTAFAAVGEVIEDDEFTLAPITAEGEGVFTTIGKLKRAWKTTLEF